MPRSNFEKLSSVKQHRVQEKCLKKFHLLISIFSCFLHCAKTEILIAFFPSMWPDTHRISGSEYILNTVEFVHITISCYFLSTTDAFLFIKYVNFCKRMYSYIIIYNIIQVVAILSRIKKFFGHSSLMMFCWNTARYFEQLILFCAVPVLYYMSYEYYFKSLANIT